RRPRFTPAPRRPFLTAPGRPLPREAAAPPRGVGRARAGPQASAPAPGRPARSRSRRPAPERMTMAQPKALQQRQAELQAVLAPGAGGEELQRLQARYQAVSGRLRPGSTSVITYILVHERERGLLSR